MNEIIAFLLNHWILSATFLVLLGLILYVETTSSAKGARKLSNQQAVHFINRENALLVDLRDPNAFLSGHIANAINILPSELAEHKRMLSHKEMPIILVCAAGMQSPALAEKLIKQGFQKVFYLGGGINGWRTEHLPIVK
jgi:rhodanese-related sulfurtransferase